MLQTVFGIETIYPSPRFTFSIVPNIGLETIGIKDDRTLAELFLKSICVDFRLRATELWIL